MTINNLNTFFTYAKIIFWGMSACWIYPLSLSAQDEELEKIFAPLQDSIRVNLYVNNEKALQYAGKYLNEAKAQNESYYIAKGLNFTGMVHYTKGEFLSAIENYIQSLEIFEELKEEWFSAVVLNNIGAAYIQRKKPIETISYYEKALEKFQALNDTLWMANVMSNLAIQQVELGNYEEALLLQRNVLSIFEALKDEESAMLIKGNMASSMRRLGRLEEGRALAMEFLSHPLAEKDLPQKANVLITLSKIESANNQHAKALDYIQTAISLCEANDMKQELNNALAQLAAVKEQLKDYPGALSAFKDFHNLYDELYSKEKDERLTELMTQYEVAQKEASIALLEQEKTIALRNQWIFGLGAALLAFLGLGIYILYRGRQKNIQILETKNTTISKMLEEKEFLIKEIHHRVKNNLQIVSSLLQLQSRYLEEPNAIEALNDGESRVKSMAIIHHYLYTEDNLSKVDLRKYLDNLLNNLEKSYNVEKKEVIIKQEIDPLFLDVSIMIPLGLIVNELVTNIYKYAFKGRDGGIIHVKVAAINHSLEVEIRDNGVGKNVTNGREGFGTRMIEAFLKKLDANIATSISDGTIIQIQIPHFEKHAVSKKSA